MVSGLSRKSTDPRSEIAARLRSEEAATQEAVVRPRQLELELLLLAVAVWLMHWLQLCRRERRKLAEVMMNLTTMIGKVMGSEEKDKRSHAARIQFSFALRG